MKIDYIKITDLKPYKLNAKRHPRTQIEGIAESIRRFGFRQPVVVDSKNEIVIGHGRVEAAKLIPHESVPCVVADDLTPDEIKALRLIDNRSAETGWDAEMLALDLQSFAFDMSPFNISFDGILPKNNEVKAGLADPDAVPEVQEKSKVQIGDVFQLGNHRLMCGDSTSLDSVSKLISENKIDLVFTDPPYGINEETDRAFASRTRKCKGNTFEKIIGDDSTETALKVFDLCNTLEIKTLIFWGGNYFASSLPDSACWCVWDKRVEDSQRDLNSDCELAYIKHPSKKSVRIFRHLWKGMIKASEQKEKRCHPTQKPVALAEWCFEEYAKDSKTVVDLFGGSGSTLIACEKSYRQCFMMEISPSYCDVIIKRWQDFTGEKAKKL